MINIELQHLMKRLTANLKYALESAAGDCMARGHFVVEMETWCLQLLNDHDMGWRVATKHCGIDHELLISRLHEKLNTYPRGNQNTPSLSPHLVEWIKDAWMLASVNHAQSHINEYHLLLVLKQRIDQGAYNGVLSQWINSLSYEWLKQSVKTFSFAENKECYAEDSLKSSETPALNRYARNLTQAARDGKLDLISGRGKEIRKVIDILCRKKQNSPILIGDPGVGKTAIVEGLAQQIVNKNVPALLANVELYVLDLTLLQAGASIKGEFENRLKDMLTEVKQSSKPIIVFIDEAHSLIGAGGAAGQNDAANILKPALARGEFRTIAATTWGEYKTYFESDAALTRRFQPVSIFEPSVEASMQMLKSVKNSLEKHHNVMVRQEAIEAAVKLSIRYLPERKLPDKAISLLDTACSRIGLSQSATPYAIDMLAEKIRHTQNEIETLIHENMLWSIEHRQLNNLKEELIALQQKHKNLTTRWHNEKKQVNEILKLQSKLNKAYLDKQDITQSASRFELKAKMSELEALQNENPLVIPQVTAQTIAEIISLWTGIPLGNMLKEEIERLNHIEKHIAKRVIGQKEQIAEIAKAIRLSRVGLSDPRKPIGVFLCCGPSGVGKTETALALTELLYGNDKNITTLNMTEFKEEFKVSMLLGAPAGYVGYGKGGVLTEAVRKNPYSVLLLDEMEKAHPSVHDIFYQIFDKGCICDSEGREVDFKNTIILMTSNAADNAVVGQCEQRRPSILELTTSIFPMLQAYFKPAFLGRVSIIPYFPLNDEELLKIARLALNRIEKRVKQHYEANFTYEEAVLTELVRRNQSPETGARAIEQMINRHLLPKLANQCICNMTEGSPINHIHILYENDQFRIQID